MTARPDGWLFAAALRLVPLAWRESVREDLLEEIGTSRLAWWRCVVAAVGVAVSLRWFFTKDALMSDVHYAIRSMLRARWFTAGAVLTFALGVGVNLAVFSAVDRMLFRSLPYAHPEDLVLLRDCPQPAGECTGSFPSAVAYEGQRHLQTIADVAVAGFARAYTRTTDINDDQILTLVAVSPNLLSVLGVRPALGHELSDDEEASRQQVVWLSEETWRGRFSADPQAIGAPLWRGTQAATIIGVLPRGFIPPAWTAVDPKWDGLVVSYDNWSTIGPTGRIAAPVARLRAGMTPAAAQVELDGFVRSRGEVSAGNGRLNSVVRVDALQDGLFSSYHRYLLLVVFAAAMILLIACANLASLMLARGRSREQQAAIRSALGASRVRLLGTALLESTFMCTAGAVLAVLALVLSSKTLVAFLPPMFSRNAAALWDTRVLGFGLLTALFSAIVTGVIPGWRVSRVDLLPLLQQSAPGGRARLTGGRTLLAFEAALGCVLVLGAGLSLRSLYKLMNDDVGIVPTGLYTVSVAPTGADPAQQLRSYERAIDVTRQIPGVMHVGGADSVVTSGSTAMHSFSADVRGGRYQATPDYFEALGTRLLAGRTFTREDSAVAAPVAILSRLGARALWPEREIRAVVGRTWTAPGETPRQIVGVVDDLKNYYGDERSRVPTVYLPIGGQPSHFTTFAVRVNPGVRLDPVQLRTTLQRELGPVRVRLTYVPDTLDPSVRDSRFRAALFVILAVTGLLLTAVGLYAIATYQVAQRRHEMGIRLTLGAEPAQVQWLVIREVCTPVLAGCALGVVFSYWSVQFARQFLYQVDGRDPWTYVLVVMILGLSAAVAAWLPARRAARLDPAVVLRAQ